MELVRVPVALIEVRAISYAHQASASAEPMSEPLRRPIPALEPLQPLECDAPTPTRVGQREQRIDLVGSCGHTIMHAIRCA